MNTSDALVAFFRRPGTRPMTAPAHPSCRDALPAQAGALDVAEVLAGQHRRIEALLGALLAAQTPAMRRQAVSALGDELLRHLSAEERVVYPAVRAARAPDVIAGSASAHRAITRSLAALRALSVCDPQFEAACRDLRDEVAHHHAAQERELLPALHLLIDATRREALGRDTLRACGAALHTSEPSAR